MKPPTVPFPRLPIVKHFQRPGQRINQQVKVKKCVYFSPPFQTFGCANQGQISLVNETFGNVHSLPSSRVNQRYPSSNVVRHGASSSTFTLPKTSGCAILRSCLRVSYSKRIRRRSSPNNAGDCAAVLSSPSPPPGKVKTPNPSGELYRSLRF